VRKLPRFKDPIVFFFFMNLNAPSELKLCGDISKFAVIVVLRPVFKARRMSLFDD